MRGFLLVRYFAMHMCIALITASAAASPAGQYKLHGPCGVKTVSTEEDVNRTLEQMYQTCGYSEDLKSNTKQIENQSVAPKFYVRGSMTFPMHRKFEGYTSKSKIGGSIAIGWEFDKNWSAELEGTYVGFPIHNKEWDFDNRKAKVWSGFVNVLFHPELVKDFPIRPFMGIGIGYTNNKVSEAKDSDGKPVDLLIASTARKVAYQALVGFEYLFNNRFSVVLDARIQQLGKVLVPDSNATVKKYRKISASMITLGGKARF
jgi:opacity protein-like surface antigen